jgi:hypothetical protein
MCGALSSANEVALTLTWSRYSKTSVSLRSVCTTSYRRTMLGCCSCFSREISRMAVLGMPSSSASSRIFLSAMISFVTRSLALYTTPYVPSPICHGGGGSENGGGGGECGAASTRRARKSPHIVDAAWSGHFRCSPIRSTRALQVAVFLGSVCAASISGLWRNLMRHAELGKRCSSRSGDAANLC